MLAAAHTYAKILLELACFATLACLSELRRRCIVRHYGPESPSVHRWFVCSLVLGWYSASVTLVLYNKWFVSHFDLEITIFYSMLHMALKGLLCFLYLYLASGQAPPLLSSQTAMAATAIGICTGLDVACSNLSFEYISASFYTMLKSASLIFLLLLSLAAGIERCSMPLVATTLLICVGMSLTASGEGKFSFAGFSLVIGSELLAAVRWLLTQVLLHKGGLRAVVLVLYMSPGSTLSLLPWALCKELDQIQRLADPALAAQLVLLVIFPGMLSLLLVLAEVQLVQETKALSMSVFGNLKSLVTVLLAMFIFGDRTSPRQWLGLALALLGILLYGCNQSGSELQVQEELRTALEIQDELHSAHGSVEIATRKPSESGSRSTAP